MTMNELLDSQDKELELLSDTVSKLQDKLEPMLTSDTPMAVDPTVKDFPSAGYVIGDHIVRSNERIADVQNKLDQLHNRLPL